MIYNKENTYKKQCKFCKKYFITILKNKEYCSKRCYWDDGNKITRNDKYYLNNREKILEKNREWHRKNKEKHNKQKREYNAKHKFQYHDYYLNNKNKSKSRILTMSLFINGKLGLKKQCSNCGSNKCIQFHHEIYPTTEKEIIKAVKNKQIYFLCLKDHKVNHRLII